MRPTTQDLLKLRDGEPVSPGLAAALDDPAVSGEVARLAQLRLELRALNQLQPPAGGWDKVRAQLDTRLSTPDAGTGSWHWPVGFALAASVALIAVLLIRQVPEQADPAQLPTTTVAGSSPTTLNGRPLVNPSYASLAAESRRLERLLADINFQPSVTRAGTASTIAELEDRIALVDYQLAGMGSHLTARQRAVLWQQRVDLMNSLVKVRYAQIQGNRF
jgi:hypothetical protein